MVLDLDVFFLDFVRFLVDSVYICESCLFYCGVLPICGFVEE